MHILEVKEDCDTLGHNASSRKKPRQSRRTAGSNTGKIPGWINLINSLRKMQDARLTGEPLCQVHARAGYQAPMAFACAQGKSGPRLASTSWSAAMGLGLWLDTSEQTVDETVDEILARVFTEAAI